MREIERGMTRCIEGVKVSRDVGVSLASHSGDWCTMKYTVVLSSPLCRNKSPTSSP